MMDKNGAGHVSWDEFERWWANRSGDTEPVRVCVCRTCLYPTFFPIQN